MTGRCWSCRSSTCTVSWRVRMGCSPMHRLAPLIPFLRLVRRRNLSAPAGMQSGKICCPVTILRAISPDRNNGLEAIGEGCQRVVCRAAGTVGGRVGRDHTAGGPLFAGHLLARRCEVPRHLLHRRAHHAPDTLGPGWCAPQHPQARAGARRDLPGKSFFQGSPAAVLAGSHRKGLGGAEKEYPRDAPPPLRFIRSCSSSLAGATLHKLEAAFHAPVLEVTLPPVCCRCWHARGVWIPDYCVALTVPVHHDAPHSLRG